MLSECRDIVVRRELLWMLVQRNLKIRYKNSVLGFFWSLLTPVLFILIYAVFAKILRFSGDNPRYMPFLITGIVVWQFLSTCLGDSLRAIAGNANLVKKTAFPRMILPLATVTANLVNFLLTALVLLIYLFTQGIYPAHLQWLLPALLTQYVLCLGISLVLSAVNVFFRDTEHMVSILTMAWFFLTPIFYPIAFQTKILAEYSWLAFMNPMTGILSVYRHVLMGDPMANSAMLSFAVSWVMLFIGWVVFSMCQKKFADEL